MLGMFLASVWQSLALQHYVALCFSSGAHAKALAQHTLFRRLVSLPQTTVRDVTAGVWCATGNGLTQSACHLRLTCLHRRGIPPPPASSASMKHVDV